MSTNFFHELTPFTTFNDLTKDIHFRELPSDWSVIITDIKGSTKAIAEGRYKDVNTIGAATIVVTRKALRGKDFPFVFGGDGATLLIHNSDVESVCESLAALRTLSNQTHELDLRVGVVSMRELYDQGRSLQVGKYEITPGRSIAIMRGEGLSCAESLIKSESGKYESKIMSRTEADLSGLSCRWNPIPSRKGKIFTILVSSRKDKKVYEDFLQRLEEIIPTGLEEANPTHVDLASYKSLGKLLSDEKKLHQSTFSKSHLLRVLEIFFAVLVFKYKFPPLFFDPVKYSQSMRTHSDFRKFDGVLRMVIDCSQNQIQEIKRDLEQKYERKDLFYGTFETDHSLMTCYVDALGQGQHIHFIDAENGGYAAAAIGLKLQMKQNT
jgi:hypothetical protein